MATIQLRDLEGSSLPDLVFGAVSAVGTPWKEGFETYLRTRLHEWGYDTKSIHTIKVSELLRDVPFLTGPYPEENAKDRIPRLMDMGNELRSLTRRPEALALLVVAKIRQIRKQTGAATHSGRAFIVHQLKRPEEVAWLRSVYGDSFHLIGLYSSQGERHQYLKTTYSLDDGDARLLMERDEREANPYGQQVRKTFYLSDVFVESVRGGSARIDQQLTRFLGALFGRTGKAIVSPSRNEYGMYAAHGAGLRSTDLSRQVGAAILTREGDVISLGCNEVPAAGGGQYWDGDVPDYRDFVKGFDFNERQRTKIAGEIIGKLQLNEEKTGEGGESRDRTADLAAILESTSLAHLMEFGRATHAEMEALLSAARRGVPVRGATLYTTVFPCHNCAKHIVGAGISEVFYIEPYPKSLALDMHNDAIWFTDYGEPVEPDPAQVSGTASRPREWVRLSPFLGIGPRRYSDLFARVGQTKVDGGAVETAPKGLRVRGPERSIGELEDIVAQVAADLKPLAD